MSDRYRIDSHKLIYHPGRVAQWLESLVDWEKAKAVYPIYMEISPFGACNHRCIFCAVDYVGYQNRKLDPAILKERLAEMARLGVRSVMFAGEGEPALYKPLPEILDHCTAVGIDTSLTTNMVPFTESNARSFLRNCAWIKTSINAGTPETYGLIHGTRPSDFDRVLGNFRLCARMRRDEGYRCTIGGQMLLLPENAAEAATLARLLREAGADYLVVKPYSQHQFSETRRYEGIDYRLFRDLERELEKEATSSFSVVFRARTMAKLESGDRHYERCLATPFFWGYVMSDGCVYGCSAFLGDDRFNYGNIHHTSFQDIWEGERRRASLEALRTMGIAECRRNCRMDEVNQYLWELTHPGPHVNFI